MASILLSVGPPGYREPKDRRYAVLPCGVGFPRQTKDVFMARIGLNLVLAALFVFSATVDVHAQSREERRDRRELSRARIESIELFGKVYERLIRNYVDELDPEELIEVAIEAMLSELDTHSQLLTEEVYEDLMTSTQGEFGGLGIQIVVRDGYPTVVSPIDGTPAFRLGIRGGDQIVEIEGESTEGWKSSDAVKVLRGPKGSQVNIGIKRPGREKVLPFNITRDIIKVESVPYAFMLDDGVGYIRISNFARTTRDELEDHMEDLERQGMTSLIIDLRTNPGGLLSAAKDVSEMFLEKGDLIVYTKGRLAQQNMSYYSTSNRGRVWKDQPLAVLVNGSSASASEILAGAVQDHDVGVVIGESTFGKGSVQTVFELSPTKALKLTTAKYYTPSGRSIHRDRNRDGSLIEEEGIDLTEEDDIEAEPETFRTDMGREVTGGGGITPDVEVEPALLSDFEVALERDATYFHFTNEWLVGHEHGGSDDFEFTDAMFETFWEVSETREDLPGYFEDMELEMSRALFEEHRDEIAVGVLREMERRQAGNAAAYRVNIERDEQVWKVVELLKENPSRAELFEAVEEMRKQKIAEAAAAAEEEEAVEVN